MSHPAPPRGRGCSHLPGAAWGARGLAQTPLDTAAAGNHSPGPLGAGEMEWGKEVAMARPLDDTAHMKPWVASDGKGLSQPAAATGVLGGM